MSITVSVIQILLVVVLVPVEVDTTRNIGLQKSQDAQEHFRAYILVELNVIVVVDPLFVTKTAFNEQLDFLMSFDSVHECVAEKAKES